MNYFSTDDGNKKYHVFGMSIFPRRTDTKFPLTGFLTHSHENTGYEHGYQSVFADVKKSIHYGIPSYILSYLDIDTNAMSFKFEDAIVTGNTVMIDYCKDFLAGYNEAKNIQRLYNQSIVKMVNAKTYAERFLMEGISLSAITRGIDSLVVQTVGDETPFTLTDAHFKQLLVYVDGERGLKFVPSGGIDGIPAYRMTNLVLSESSEINGIIRLVDNYLVLLADNMEVSFWDTYRNHVRNELYQKLSNLDLMENLQNPYMKND